MKWVLTTLLVLVLSLNFSCTKSPEQSREMSQTKNRPAQVKVPEDLVKAMKAVEPFFEPMPEPGEMDWLATFPEKGQTFEEYINGDPTLPTEERKIIYIQPIGKFDPEQRKVIELTSEYMDAFYGLPVKLLPEKKFDEPVSLENYRIHPSWRIKQIRTGYILENILFPALPGDAAAMIAFTNEDLFPDKNMNFVFGQASLQNRVGVWSLYRMKEGGAGFETFLARTLKIAAHETGHMFSFAHCTKYKCVMSGTNGNFETDTHPIDACPECMAKIAWGMKYSPAERYRRLAEFCQKNGLEADAKTFEEKRKTAEAVN